MVRDPSIVSPSLTGVFMRDLVSSVPSYGRVHVGARCGVDARIAPPFMEATDASRLPGRGEMGDAHEHRGTVRTPPRSQGVHHTGGLCDSSGFWELLRGAEVC